MNLRALLLFILAAVAAIGCNKSGQPAQSLAMPATTTGTAAPAPAANFGTPASAGDSDAVRQAVEDHVRNNHGINMSAMDMSVDSVSVNGDQAQANTTFKVKGGGATMAMVYSLERHGNGWLVLKSQPSNGEFVHPPMDKIHSGAAAAAPPAASSSGTPDVTDFLKNHPAPKSN